MKKILTVLFVIVFFIIFPYGVFAVDTISSNLLFESQYAINGGVSYNQSMVSNKNGIFVTYAYMVDGTSRWRLVRSLDQGKTFSTVYESISVSTAASVATPLVETDSNGDIIVLTVSTDELMFTISKFSIGNNFSAPIISVETAIGGIEKYSLLVDSNRRKLYFAAQPGSDYGIRFHIFNLDSLQLESNYILSIQGSNAVPSYPQLILDENNILFLAWTTGYLHSTIPALANAGYWDIHTIKSPDGGHSWQTLTGASLTIPVVGDDTGPTTRITPDDEFIVPTWLANFRTKEGKLFFPYQARFDNTKQHFIRFDTGSGTKDLDITPVWAGGAITLNGVNVACATRVTQSKFPLVCFSNTADGYLGAIISYDKGSTWQEQGKTSTPFAAGREVTYLTTDREISPYGYLIGKYREQPAWNVLQRVSIPSSRNGIISSVTIDQSTLTMTVSFNNPNAKVSDWIGVYPNSASTLYKDWKYLNNQITTPASPVTSGSINLSYKQGETVEVRYFSLDQSSYQLKYFQTKLWPKTGEPVLTTILNGQTVTVDYQNIVVHPTDWLGIYKKGALDNQYLNWRWLNNSKDSNYPANVNSSGSISFTVADPGDYEVRYFTYDMTVTGFSWKNLSQKTVSIGTILPGDLNHDGKVDIFDYNPMLQNFGSTTCGNVADINNDCKVDIFDYNTLVQNFGKTN